MGGTALSPLGSFLMGSLYSGSFLLRTKVLCSGIFPALEGALVAGALCSGQRVLKSGVFPVWGGGLVQLGLSYFGSSFVGRGRMCEAYNCCIIHC